MSKEKYKNPILNKREKTHGNFSSVAACTLELITVFNKYSMHQELSKVQIEALHMDFVKTARLACGNINTIDHWRDKAGYAELVVKDLEF